MVMRNACVVSFSQLVFWLLLLEGSCLRATRVTNEVGDCSCPDAGSSSI